MIGTLRAKSKRSNATTLSVLVADDEPADNLLFTLAAEEAGVATTLTFAEDGLQLLDLLREQVTAGDRPDVIVLDVRMPRCTGLEVMAHISETPSLQGIPVVMLSASRDEADMNRAIALGAIQFEIKPSSYPELVTFIRSLAALAAPE